MCVCVFYNASYYVLIRLINGRISLQSESKSSLKEDPGWQIKVNPAVFVAHDPDFMLRVGF